MKFEVVLKRDESKHNFASFKVDAEDKNDAMDKAEAYIYGAGKRCIICEARDGSFKWTVPVDTIDGYYIYTEKEQPKTKKSTTRNNKRV